MKPHESLFDGYLILNGIKALQNGESLDKHLKNGVIFQNPTLGLFDCHVIDSRLETILK